MATGTITDKINNVVARNWLCTSEGVVTTDSPVAMMSARSSR
jgi:hypothetical protein